MRRSSTRAWEGEHYDARLEQPGWSDTGFDDSGWTPAPEQAAPTRKTLAMAMEPIQIAETLPAVSSSTPAPGVTVYDFGRTIAGWAQITVAGTAGTTITLTYGETLNPDGTVATLGELVHVDSYTLSGRDEEIGSRASRATASVLCRCPQRRLRLRQ